MMWNQVEMGKVADVVSGYGFPRECQGLTDEELPFFKVGDMNLPGNEKCMTTIANTISRATLKKLKAKTFPKGTIIFPKIGAAIATNKKRVLTQPSVVDNNVMGLIPKPHINPWYLYYWMLQFDLRSVSNIGPVPSMRKTEVERVAIPLPPLSEQHRIVEILDQADTLRKKRAEADAKAARILPALFYKMFGDPATNPKEWPVQPLGYVSGQNGLITDGDWILSKNMDSNGSIRLIQLADIGIGTFLDRSRKYITEEKFRELKCTEVREGDLLISRMADPIGRACIVPSLQQRAITAVDCTIVRPDRTVALPEYLSALCNTEYFFKKAASAATGTTRGRITRRNLEKIEIPIPPIAEQMKFVALFKELAGNMDKQQQSSEMLELLCRTLLHRAFTGDLTAKWREAHMKELLAEMEHQAKALKIDDFRSPIEEDYKSSIINHQSEIPHD